MENTTVVANAVKNNMSLGGRLKLGWMRHGADISFVAGVAGLITAGVMGALGAIKAKTILDQRDVRNEEVKNHIGKPIMINGEEREYTQEDAEHDLKVIRKDTILGIVKALGPALGVGVASVGLQTYAHVNQAGKIAGLTAYASAQGQVIARAKSLLAEQMGEKEADLALAGYRKEERVVQEVDEKTGEIKETVEEVLVRDLDIPSDGIFTFTFRNGWLEWSPCYERNVHIVTLRLKEWETKLNRAGAGTIEDLMEMFEAPSEDRHGWDHVCGNIWTPGRMLEYEILPRLADDDYDVTFILKTDGVILKKIDDARKEYEKRVGYRR